MKTFLVVDDHKMFVDGITLVLHQNPQMKVTDFALNGEDAIFKVSKNSFDYVLMDIGMKEMNGIETLKQIKKINAGIKVIMVTMHNDFNTIMKALKAGANGFLLKNTGAEEIEEAIRHIENGESYLSESLRKMVLDFMLFNSENLKAITHPIELLTKREKEIVILVAGGFTTHQIAEKLFLSEKTVETHRKNILHKLKIGNTASLVKFAAENDLL